MSREEKHEGKDGGEQRLFRILKAVVDSPDGELSREVLELTQLKKNGAAPVFYTSGEKLQFSKKAKTEQEDSCLRYGDGFKYLFYPEGTIHFSGVGKGYNNIFVVVEKDGKIKKQSLTEN